MTIDIIEQDQFKPSISNALVDAVLQETPCTADVSVTEAELEREALGTRSLFSKMPDSGPGFACYGPLHKRYGRAEVVAAILRVCRLWHQEYPNGPRIRVGNISLQGGGRMEPHTSHQKGIDVDFALISTSQEEIPLTWEHPKYSQARTQQLIDLIYDSSMLKVRSIFFNDPNVRGVGKWPGHDNHLHVSFFPSGVSPLPFGSDQGLLRLTIPPMKGERVRKLQAGLVSAGISISVDSIFGEETDAAVRKFQAQHGLDVDGQAGIVTLAQLRSVKDGSLQVNESRNTAVPVASQMLLQAIIDQNRVIDFSDLNDSDLIDEPDLCREVQTVLHACNLLEAVDGIFGPRTQGAVRSFKAAHQLSGGDILDAATAQALLLARPVGGTLPAWTGGDKQAAIQAIIREAHRHGIMMQPQIAYILATVEHETAGSFQPVREAYFLGEPKAENFRKRLRYYPYYGRGYVQLTWDYNYRKYSTLLGLDLVNQPDLVMRPDIALFILIDGMKRGTFTGVGLDRYITDRHVDFKNARRIINGMDKASEISGIASNWSSSLA